MVNRRSAYLYRIGFSYLFLLAAIFRGIVLVPLYLKHMSVGMYGAWTASGAIIAYLGLLDFGFAAVITQKVAQAYGGKNYNQVSSFSTAGILVGVCLSGMVGVLGYYLTSWVPGFVGVTGTDVLVLTSALRIQVIATAMMLSAYFASGILIALQRTLANALTNFVALLAGIVVTLYGLGRGWGLVSLPLGSAVSAVIFLGGMITLLMFAWKKDINVRPHINPGDFAYLGNLSGFVFLGKISSNLIKRSDIIVVSRIMGVESAAVFNLTVQVGTQAKTIPDRIASLIVPSLAHLVGEKGLERSKQIALDVLSVSIGVTSVFFATILALNESFVHLWVGDNLFGGTALTVGMCVYFSLDIGRNTLANLLFAVGEIRIPSLLALGEAGLKLVLVIGGVYWLGLWGAPLGSILALLTINGLYLFRLFVRRFGITHADLGERLRELALFPLIAFVVGITWYYSLSPRDWLGFVVNVLVIVAILSSILWLMNPSLREEVKTLIRSLVHRFLPRGKRTTTIW